MDLCSLAKWRGLQGHCSDGNRCVDGGWITSDVFPAPWDVNHENLRVAAWQHSAPASMPASFQENLVNIGATDVLAPCHKHCGGTMLCVGMLTTWAGNHFKYALRHSVEPRAHR